MDTTTILFCVIAFFVGGLVFGVAAFFVGVKYRKRVAEAEIGSAEEEAKRIVAESEKEADSKKREALVEAKDEIHKMRTEAEREIKELRSDVNRQERRVQQKEESLDRKLDNVERKDEQAQNRLKQAEEKLKEAEIIKKSQLEQLERISELTVDQARQQLLDTLEGELVHEKALKIQNFEQQLKDEIVSLAISRCAAETVSEATVSVVSLPNDEMKGRIIGREGRNIRTIETLTGVDLIIDDTPEAITLSSHDPVRREIARQAGERAVLETNLHGIHPELVKLLGRLRFRTSYGQNVLNHSIEVAYFAGMMASELGVDPVLARRAGLLHDIGKALNHEIEGSHVEIGVDVCRKYKESNEVIHAIQAHHNDVEPKTVVACLVQAADAISAARPAARRENLENYIKRLEKLEEIANSFEGVEKSFAIQAGREIRIMVKPEVIKDEKMILVARDIVNRIENELEYPGQIKVNLVRESRAIDYAK